MHTAEAEADIVTVAETMETLEAWVLEWVTKSAEVQAEAEAQEEIGSTEQQAEAEAHQALDKMVRTLHRQTELEALDMLEDLDSDLEHQAAELDQTTAGHHGLVSVAQAVTDNMDLLEAEAEAAELEAEDLVVAELEAHKQSITLVEQEEMEQAQAEAETTINQESVKREVLA